MFMGINEPSNERHKIINNAATWSLDPFGVILSNEAIQNERVSEAPMLAAFLPDHSAAEPFYPKTD